MTNGATNVTWLPGGGGGYFHMPIGYVPRERLPFSALNFLSGAYHFHKYLNIPLRSITIFTYFFAIQETIIFEISLPTAGLLSWAPRARSGAQHLHARATRARSGALHFCRGTPRGLAAGRVPARRVRQSVPETHITSTLELPELAPVPRIFTLELPELAPEPAFVHSSSIRSPIFHLAAAHTYQHLGWLPHPRAWLSFQKIVRVVLFRREPAVKQSWF